MIADHDPAITVSPSDLSYLWEDCKRCFWLKYVTGRPRPRMPFPSVFNRLDKCMKSAFDGRSTSILSKSLPEGGIILRRAKVTSDLLGVGRRFRFAGFVDAVISYYDGLIGVIDFKTGTPSAEGAERYARQLGAYLVALAHPDHGVVNMLGPSGLLYWTPDPDAEHRLTESDLHNTPATALSIVGRLTWSPLDDETLINLTMPLLIERLAEFFEKFGPDSDGPSPGDDCPFCHLVP